MYSLFRQTWGLFLLQNDGLYVDKLSLLQLLKFVLTGLQGVRTILKESLVFFNNVKNARTWANLPHRVFALDWQKAKIGFFRILGKITIFKFRKIILLSSFLSSFANRTGCRTHVKFVSWFSERDCLGALLAGKISLKCRFLLW